MAQTGRNRCPTLARTWTKQVPLMAEILVRSQADHRPCLSYQWPKPLSEVRPITVHAVLSVADSIGRREAEVLS